MCGLKESLVGKCWDQEYTPGAVLIKQNASKGFGTCQGISDEFRAEIFINRCSKITQDTEYYKWLLLLFITTFNSRPK